jgi:hypothetical protein
VKFDFSGVYGPDFRALSDNFGFRARNQTQFLYTYFVGPQFFLPVGRARLFAHALAGATQMRRGFTFSQLAVGRTDFAFGSAVGGGLDISLTRNVALRVAQADYLISKNFGGSENSLRVSGGIVFQFGSR